MTRSLSFAEMSQPLTLPHVRIQIPQQTFHIILPGKQVESLYSAARTFNSQLDHIGLAGTGYVPEVKPGYAAHGMCLVNQTDRVIAQPVWLEELEEPHKQFVAGHEETHALRFTRNLRLLTKSMRSHGYNIHMPSALIPAAFEYRSVGEAIANTGGAWAIGLDRCRAYLATHRNENIRQGYAILSASRYRPVFL